MLKIFYFQTTDPCLRCSEHVSASWMKRVRELALFKEIYDGITKRLSTLSEEERMAFFDGTDVSLWKLKQEGTVPGKNFQIVTGSSTQGETRESRTNFRLQALMQISGGSETVGRLKSHSTSTLQSICSIR